MARRRPQLLPGTMVSPAHHEPRMRRYRSGTQLASLLCPLTTGSSRKRKPLLVRRPIRSWLPRIVIATYLIGWALYYVADTTMRWIRLPRYASFAERRFRENRFPSVEQRVRLYMSDWYRPPCPGTPQLSATAVSVPQRSKNLTTTNFFWITTSTVTRNVSDVDYSLQDMMADQTLIVSNMARPDQVFYFNEDELFHCYKQKDWSIRFYCQDARLSMQPDISKIGRGIPVFLEFTDHSWTTFVVTGEDGTEISIENPNVPVIKKLRRALSKAESDEVMNNTANNSSPCQDLTKSPAHRQYRNPIIWLLNIKRHYKYALDVPRYDIPWSKKKDSAIFRGDLSGFQNSAKLSSALENCERLPRCRLVYHNAQSKLVDARITDTFDKVPEVISGLNVTGSKLRRYDMLQHKGLIILEGNDVSSGLKWSMVSNSVVLMPPPIFTSWAMEELLEPWYHFIPLLPDLSDVEQKVQWMLDNQEESKRIAHRAKLWVLDLYFHPNAMRDAKLINEEILRRYRLLFNDTAVGPKRSVAERSLRQRFN